MDERLIYTDICSEKIEKELAAEAGALIVKRMSDDTWTVNESMRIITDPSLELAVINRLDSISLMEISLLHFMAKPILVTTETISNYPAVVRAVDYIDGQCSLVQDHSSFISWYSAWKEGTWNRS